MALSESAFCTLAELHSYLATVTGDTYGDTRMEMMIEDASMRIIDYIGYDPHGDTYSDELYSGDGSRELVVRNRPVTSVVAIKMWDGSAYTDIDSDDLAQMQVRDWYIDGVDYTFERGRSNYAVTYVAGWSDTECDKRFALTCMRIASWLERESGKKGVLGMSSQAFGDGSRSSYEDVIGKALEDLSAYRRLTP